MLYQLAVEVEQDETGFHAVIIDVSDDSVLHVTNSFFRLEDAERAADDWIAKNQ